ncbi:MAG: glycosyltransferase family 8 protein [Hyphomonadaceae bacterium]|nr:glycosyltransferase family 8 protein [Hyphomonadaceae bacterium]MBC6413095.1 glycosyltransferase family 8 protein [Hyphomonadaceae bacterium]
MIKAETAYVTLLTHHAYLPGAVALVRSLTLTGTTADIVILHTEGIVTDMLKPLVNLGAKPVQVDLLDVSDEFRQTHRKDKIHGDAPFTKGRKPDFHTPLANFAKLRLWQLTQYDKVVFLDADVIVIRNIDALFDYPEFCGAPNVYESLRDFHRLNSGVFTAKPSEITFSAMMDKLDTPGVFWQRTDQTFLQSYFPDWHGLPIFYNTLQYIWFNLPELWNWNSVRVIHYQYEKPWETDNPRARRLGPLIDIWQAYCSGKDIPEFSDMPNPSFRI